ncbi:hypothetical protein BH11MYX4_BH11MYX4_17870 [soil metagenome]
MRGRDSRADRRHRILPRDELRPTVLDVVDALPELVGPCGVELIAGVFVVTRRHAMEELVRELAAVSRGRHRKWWAKRSVDASSPSMSMGTTAPAIGGHDVRQGRKSSYTMLRCSRKIASTCLSR